ncbi:MAG TPA: SPW repeat protein [Hyalangium sp.]|jgi:hypothetical protein|nr:SPW repeat protein [Hyalangium sp.]
MWARWLNLILGVWLFIAPVVFRYPEPAVRLNETVVGLAVAIVAMLASSAPALRFINVALGAWLLLAPNVLGYGDRALPTAHAIILGSLIICSALAPAARPTVRGLRRLVKT